MGEAKNVTFLGDHSLNGNGVPSSAFQQSLAIQTLNDIYGK